MAFVLWLLQGAWAVGRPGSEFLSLRADHDRLGAYGFVCGLFIPSIAVLGVVQHLTMGLLLLGGALAAGPAVARHRVALHRPLPARRPGAASKPAPTGST